MEIESSVCIAIYVPEGGNITRERLLEASKANPDGWGVMEAINGTLRTLKSSSFIDAPIFKPCVIHFRTASASGIGLQFCHPHIVNDNLAFVHNGNLFEFSGWYHVQRNDNLSDSIRFRDFLRKLPPDFLGIQEIWNAINDYCVANFSKVVFMDNTGRVNIMNEQAGEWVDGCWYSNGGIENYIGYGYSGAYPYREMRHRGGLMSVQMFKDKDKWGQCPECKGWFDTSMFTNGICKQCQSYINLMRFVNEP